MSTTIEIDKDLYARVIKPLLAQFDESSHSEGMTNIEAVAYAALFYGNVVETLAQHGARTAPDIDSVEIFRDMCRGIADWAITELAGRTQVEL